MSRRPVPLESRIDRSNDHQESPGRCLSIVLLTAPQFFLFEPLTSWADLPLQPPLPPSVASNCRPKRRSKITLEMMGGGGWWSKLSLSLSLFPLLALSSLHNEPRARWKITIPLRVLICGERPPSIWLLPQRGCHPFLAYAALVASHRVQSASPPAPVSKPSVPPFAGSRSTMCFSIQDMPGCGSARWIFPRPCSPPSARLGRWRARGGAPWPFCLHPNGQG